ncbi:MAG: hypothetical protein ACJ73D_06270 [Pyrinomonadaceae bacterium]
MKRLQYFVLPLCLVCVGVCTASAQKRTTHKTTGTKTAATTTVPPLEVRAARDKVDTQLSNVNVWLDKYGPVALNLDAVVADEKEGKLTPSTAQKIDANRAKVVESIRNLKAGLTSLESEFRTKAALAKYLPMIQGITDLASKAEDSAIAGQFVAAKDPLRDVSKKLTDTLTAMPKMGV